MRLVPSRELGTTGNQYRKDAQVEWITYNKTSVEQMKKMSDALEELN